MANAASGRRRRRSWQNAWRYHNLSRVSCQRSTDPVVLPGVDARGPGKSARERVVPARGFEELAELGRPAAGKPPHVDERDVERPARLLRDAAVPAEDDDGLPRVDELVRIRAEALPPVAVERREDLA